jgi:hypothetical protein
MKFWKEASANELRNQILQRTGVGRMDLRVKTREQLLNIIRNMILDGKW